MTKNRLKKVGAFCLVLSVLLVVLSGCWASDEPKDFGVINSILYGMREDNTFYAKGEFVNPEAIGGESATGSAKHYIGVGEGEDVAICLNNLSSRLDKMLFGQHNKARIFSSTLASDKHAVHQVFDHLARSNLGDERPLLFVISEEDAGKVYEADLGLAGLLGDYLVGVQASKKKVDADGVFVTGLDFLRDYHLDGKEPVMGRIALKPNSKKTDSDSEREGDKQWEIDCTGLAVFRGTRLVGYLNGDETVAYSLLTGRGKVAPLHHKFENGMRAMGLVKNANTKISGELLSGASHITVQVSCEYLLEMYLQENEDKEDESIQKAELERAIGKQLQGEFLAAIQTAQGLKSDIFAFGANLRAKDAKGWRQVAAGWNDNFAASSVTVEVTVALKTNGQKIGSHLVGR